jgi:hypothetical protein
LYWLICVGPKHGKEAGVKRGKCDDNGSQSQGEAGKCSTAGFEDGEEPAAQKLTQTGKTKETDLPCRIRRNPTNPFIFDSVRPIFYF